MYKRNTNDCTHFRSALAYGRGYHFPSPAHPLCPYWCWGGAQTIGIPVRTCTNEMQMIASIFSCVPLVGGAAVSTAPPTRLPCLRRRGRCTNDESGCTNEIQTIAPIFTFKPFMGGAGEMHLPTNSIRIKIQVIFFQSNSIQLSADLTLANFRF